MKQLDFHNEEVERIEETLKKLDVRAPEVAAILRRHVKIENQPPRATREEEKPKRDSWGVGAALPEKDL